MSHIRNADLSKMSDKALESEADYLYNQCFRTIVKITHNTNCIKLGEILTVPIWKLTEDYNLLIERIQMVMEEIQYRKIP